MQLEATSTFGHTVHAVCSKQGNNVSTMPRTGLLAPVSTFLVSLVLWGQLALRSSVSLRSTLVRVAGWDDTARQRHHIGETTGQSSVR